MNHIPTSAEKDEDGTLLVRPKFASKGWTYHDRAIEFELSVLNSVHNKKHDGTEWSDTTYKLYDINDAEILDQGVADTDCVKTVLDFEPTYNYEIIGGSIVTLSEPSSDVRLWVVAVPDLPENMGGTKTMLSGFNFRFLPTKTPKEIDGRTSKRLTYDATYHTNKLRLIFKHNAGYKIRVQLLVEQYK